MRGDATEKSSAGVPSPGCGNFSCGSNDTTWARATGTAPRTHRAITVESVLMKQVIGRICVLLNGSKGAGRDRP